MGPPDICKKTKSKKWLTDNKGFSNLIYFLQKMSEDVNPNLRYLGKLVTIELLMGEMVEDVNTYYIEYSTFFHNTMPQLPGIAKHFSSIPSYHNN